MIRKTSILRSNFIGVYARVWEDVAFVPVPIEDDSLRDIEEGLQVKTEKILIDNSNLIGSLMVLNSRGIILPVNSEKLDLNLASGRNILYLKDRINAVGNDIVANDHAAMVHRGYTASSIKKIADTLDVEVVKGTIGGIKTVGSASVLSAKGMLVTPDADEEEMKFLSDLFKVPVKSGTANFGNMYVGSSILANSKGVLVGKDTTPVEIGRIDDILS
ncbi:MAG: translation initiation factor IF-6 [Candidatus Thermoplasmatota archaeon]|jgi:translation initiation factor 6|nr:translation initiation factor IF-6 [Candidatus Thermoplasmatota archaeon]